MTDPHCSDDQLLARLYGVQPGDGHLDECPECLRRWEEISLRRRELLEDQPHIPAGHLADQRRAILSRIVEARSRPAVRLVPALASFFVLVVVLALFHQKPSPPISPETADSAIYEDVINLASGEQPEAVEPIQALFEVQP
jgi:hypothetical protein